MRCIYCCTFYIYIYWVFIVYIYCLLCCVVDVFFYFFLIVIWFALMICFVWLILLLCICFNIIIICLNIIIYLFDMYRWFALFGACVFVCVAVWLRCYVSLFFIYKLCHDCVDARLRFVLVCFDSALLHCCLCCALLICWWCVVCVVV